MRKEPNSPPQFPKPPLPPPSPNNARIKSHHLNALAALARRSLRRYSNNAMPLPQGYSHRFISGTTMVALVDQGLVWTDGYDYALTEAGKCECRTRHIPISASVSDAKTPPKKVHA